MESPGSSRTHSSMLPASISSSLTSRPDSSLETQLPHISCFSYSEIGPWPFPVLKPPLSFGACSPPLFLTWRNLQVSAHLQRCLMTWSNLSQLKLHPFPQALTRHLLNSIQRNIYWDRIYFRHYVRYQIATTTAIMITHVISINKGWNYFLQFNFLTC